LGQLIDVASLSFTAPSLTVTITLHNASVSQGISVCYEDPTSFRDITGAMVNTGLLPTCATTSNAPPCLAGVAQIQRNVAVTLLIPPGDPKVHIFRKHPKVH